MARTRILCTVVFAGTPRSWDSCLTAVHCTIEKRSQYLSLVLRCILANSEIVCILHWNYLLATCVFLRN
jgi:hypothetical protein